MVSIRECKVGKTNCSSLTERKKCVSGNGSSNVLSKAFCASCVRHVEVMRKIFLSENDLRADIELNSRASSMPKVAMRKAKKSGLFASLMPKLSQSERTYDSAFSGSPTSRLA